MTMKNRRFSKIDCIFVAVHMTHDSDSNVKYAVSYTLQTNDMYCS